MERNEGTPPKQTCRSVFRAVLPPETIVCKNKYGMPVRTSNPNNISTRRRKMKFETYMSNMTSTDKDPNHRKTLIERHNLNSVMENYSHCPSMTSE